MVRIRTPSGCQNGCSVRSIWHPAGMQEWLRPHRGYRRARRSSTLGDLLASRWDGQERHAALLLLHRKQRRTRTPCLPDVNYDFSTRSPHPCGALLTKFHVEHSHRSPQQELCAFGSSKCSDAAQVVSGIALVGIVGPCFRQTRRILMSDGVTPEMRDA